MKVETHEQALARLRRTVDEAEEVFARHRRTQEANRENRRRRDAMDLLEYAIPDFAAPMRRLRRQHDEAVEMVRNDRDLSDEGKDRKLRELSANHREEARRELEVVRDRISSYLSRYRAIAKLDDEPADELRYSRLEREYRAKVEAGLKPDLQSYWDAIESGDADLVRVYETYAPLHIEDNARRNEFVAEIGNQRQARLSDEQKLAWQRTHELQAKQDDFERGLRLGAFGREVLEVAQTEEAATKEDGDG